MTLMSSLFRKISISLGPCINEFTIQLPDFSQESVNNLVKLSNLDWTEHHVWSGEDLELFQSLGIVVSVKLRDSPDILIDEIIEDDPAEPVVPRPKRNAKLKSVKTANLLKPASVKNNNSRSRKRKLNSVDVDVISPRNIQTKHTYDGYNCSPTVKKCKVMLKKETFANIDPSFSVTVSSLERRERESDTPHVTKPIPAKSERGRKNLAVAPVMLVENPLYDNGEEDNQTNIEINSFETEQEDRIIDKIVSIIKTNDLIKGIKSLKKEEIENSDEKEKKQLKEADREEHSTDKEEEYEIQKTLILDQDFSDDEGSDHEDYLGSSALHNTRDTILKELGLSDDDSY